MEVLFNKDNTARLIERDNEVYLKTKEGKKPVFKIFYFGDVKYYLIEVDLKAQLIWKTKYALFEPQVIEIIKHNKIEYILIKVDTRIYGVPVEDIVSGLVPASIKNKSGEMTLDNLVKLSIGSKPKYMMGLSVNLIVLYPEIDKIIKQREENPDDNPEIGDKVEFGGNIGIVQALTNKSNNAYVKFPIIGTRLIKRNQIRRSGKNEWEEN